MSELEAAFKLGVRLSALEYLVARTHALLLLSTLGSREEVLKALDDHAEQAPQTLFEGLDPVWSDAASDEWSEAVRRLVDLQRDILASTGEF